MLFKNICLVIYTIIAILFTIGYSALPIISNQFSNYNTTFYISSFTLLINDAQNTYKNVNYKDLTIGGIIDIIFKTLLYSCIAVSCLIVLGILLALFGLKFISKIIFLIALIVMVLVFSIITLIVTKNSSVKDFMNYFSVGGDSNINYKSGGVLITVSTALMFINYLLYAFLA